MSARRGEQDPPRSEDGPGRDRPDVARLMRRLEREHAIRLEAENIGERVTAELYSSVQRLQQLQALHDEQGEAMLRLRDLDEAKDAFLSTVSHEFRTPLTSMMGYLELIADGDLETGSARMSSAVEVMTRNTQRLLHLVNDLLAFSSLQQGQGDDLGARVDMVDLVDEVHRTLAPVARRRGVTVTPSTLGEVPAIVGERDLIDRAVLNLLSNAIKFTPAGGHVRTRTWAERGAVLLEVTDTGIGIPAEEQDNLFTPFFRSSLSIAREIQGTGLGLALVRAAVDRHQGDVQLTSVEGEGTTVTVRLPVRASTPAVGATPG